MHSFRTYLPVALALGIIGFVICTPTAQAQDPAGAATQSDPEKAPIPEVVSFKKDIAPFIKVRCAKCHTGEAAKAGVDVSKKANLLTKRCTNLLR